MSDASTGTLVGASAISHSSRRVKKPAQGAKTVLDRVAMQRCAALARALGQPALVGLDVCSAEIGDATRGRVVLDDESGELPQVASMFFTRPGGSVIATCSR
jgi:hypothetical protein